MKKTKLMHLELLKQSLHKKLVKIEIQIEELTKGDVNSEQA